MAITLIHGAGVHCPSPSRVAFCHHGVEAAEAIEELELGGQQRGIKEQQRAAVRHGRECRRELLSAVDLLVEAAAAAEQDGSRHTLQQTPDLRRWDSVRRMNTAPRVSSAAGWPRDWLARSTASRAPCRSAVYDEGRSFSTTRSTASRFIRQCS